MAGETTGGRDQAADGWEITGNHYLTFSRIARDTGAIHSLNVLHRGLLGLVEWAADRNPGPGTEPLLEPYVRAGDEVLSVGELRWERLDRWIPTFRCELPTGLSLTGTVCAPGGFDPLVRGGFLLLEVQNRGATEREVEIGLTGCWRWTMRCVQGARPIDAPHVLARGGDGNGFALETGGRAALAVAAGPRARYTILSDGEETEATAGEESRASPGEPLRFRVSRRVPVRAGRRNAVAFYFGVAPERDGALATAAYLSGRGSADLLRLARLDLARIARPGRDSPLLAILNRNFVFCHYCGIARAVDDDRIYPIASRIPMHGATAVFDERSALIWTLPAITRVDAYLGRELLVRVLEGFSDRPGQRQRYVDGGVLAPGFSLGQLCAYGLAIDRYVGEANDPTVLDEPLVQDVIRELDENLWSRLHTQVFLGATEVLASGDPADYPYVSYDNALLWRFCKALPQLWRPLEGEPPARLENGADEIDAAFWHRFTAEIEGLQVIACASNLEGQVAIYDDPAGSLRMLPFFGFCSEDDPIWSNTMDLLHSRAYPLWKGESPFPGFAGRSNPNACSLAALAADLLTGRRNAAISLLRRLSLECGLASSTYDPDTGGTASGPYDAALAGFLAWALDQTQEEPAAKKKGTRR